MAILAASAHHWGLRPAWLWPPLVHVLILFAHAACALRF